MYRLAIPDDLHAVFTIYMDEAVLRFLGYDAMSLEQFSVIFEDLLASCSFFVYLQEDEVAGFYKVTRFTGRAAHVAQLGTLAVAPRYQGKGVAQAMLAVVIAELRQTGVRRVELIVESDNPRGLAFYQRLGFEIEGRLRQFYKRSGEAEYIDDFIMAKLLD
ncbi:GNAT family N-acetyltransferase [Undibacterium sp. TS12]|uniref:GNAT family N-acetyltransferase n=1 Tax=Undibacterium sp. TS12 TaxID=2908202 RepID=UPI001F4C9A1C|nr:GNAT family N-acetyltransferase [Undibacterium sp. TS12]MCH8618084.1 GNAT family N-acetyltransferase [Undibacterium sp. TS12]